MSNNYHKPLPPTPPTPIHQSPLENASQPTLAGHSAEFKGQLTKALSAKKTPATPIANKPLSERAKNTITQFQTKLSSLSHSLKALFTSTDTAQAPSKSALLEFQTTVRTSGIYQATPFTTSLESLPLPPTSFPAIQHFQECLIALQEAQNNKGTLTFDPESYNALIDSLKALDTFTTHEPKKQPNWAQLKTGIETLVAIPKNSEKTSDALKQQTNSVLKQIDSIVDLYIERAETFNYDIAAAKNHLQTNPIDYLAIATITCGVIGISAILIGLGTTAMVVAAPAIGAALFATGIALSFLVAATGSLGMLLSIDYSNWAYNKLTTDPKEEPLAYAKADTDERKKDQFIDAQHDLREKIALSGLKSEKAELTKTLQLNTQQLIEELKGIKTFIASITSSLQNKGAA